MRILGISAYYHDAAAAIFAEKGYSLTKLSDIAQSAGIHLTGLYYYYDNREKILEWIGQSEDLKKVWELAEKMKSDLAKLEDQVQSARRKKEELVRRKLAADAQMRTHQALQKSHEAMSTLAGSVTDIDNHTSAIESYKDKILQMEAEAEAAEELLKLETAGSEKDIELDKKVKQKAVDDELAKLKQKLSGNKS